MNSKKLVAERLGELCGTVKCTITHSHGRLTDNSVNSAVLPGHAQQRECKWKNQLHVTPRSVWDLGYFDINGFRAAVVGSCGLGIGQIK